MGSDRRNLRRRLALTPAGNPPAATDSLHIPPWDFTPRTKALSPMLTIRALADGRWDSASPNTLTGAGRPRVHETSSTRMVCFSHRGTSPQAAGNGRAAAAHRSGDCHRLIAVLVVAMRISLTLEYRAGGVHRWPILTWIDAHPTTAAKAMTSTIFPLGAGNNGPHGNDAGHWSGVGTA